MIDILEFKGEDFKAVCEFEGWKIGLLRYSERFSDFKVLERHNLTDEVFVLLEGSATIYLSDENDKISEYIMEKNTVYNVHKGVWHHIVVSEDATVLIVENSNTSKENTRKEEYNAYK